MRGNTIHYQRRVGSRRFQVSTETDSWPAAALWRDVFEQELGIRRGASFAPPCNQTFGEVAEQYLDHGTRKLRQTTRGDFFTRAMFGGWGMWDSKGGTDYMIDAVVKYRFSESWTAQAGVRWFDMNVEGDKLDYEVDNAYGPAFGVVWSF